MPQTRYVGVLAERPVCGQQQSADILTKQEYSRGDPNEELSVILSNISLHSITKFHPATRVETINFICFCVASFVSYCHSLPPF